MQRSSYFVWSLGTFCCFLCTILTSESEDGLSEGETLISILIPHMSCHSARPCGWLNGTTFRPCNATASALHGELWLGFRTRLWLDSWEEREYPVQMISLQSLGQKHGLGNWNSGGLG